MRNRRLVVATAALALAGAALAPASAVSSGHSGLHPAAHPAAHRAATQAAAIAPRVYLWPAGSAARHAVAPGGASKGPQQLTYSGGREGHGVLTQPVVYLVFWGS